MYKLKSNLLKSDLSFTSHDSLDVFKVSLILIFSVLYLPHAFVLVDDVGLIVSYEVDPGSIIYAIEDILRTYNMHSGYHSKFYGWTYFSINYIFLIPIKVFCLLFGIESKFYLYNAIRLILFSIGLISLVVFYEILKKLFSNKMLPFIGALFYILCDTGYKYFYFLHPETTGMMFVFFALLCLLKFIENPQGHKIYFYGLIFLVLASLSKQFYFFISLPILALFFHFYCVNEKKRYIDFLLSKQFIKILKYTIIISVSILLVIHPFSIFEFQKFLEYQSELSMFISGDYSVSLDESFEAWKIVFFSAPIIKLSTLLFPVSFVVSVICYLKSKNSKHIIYIVSSASLILLSCLIIVGNRLFINSSYIYPLYPFFIINLLSIIFFIKNTNFKKFQIVKFAIVIFFTYFIIFSLSRSIYYNIPRIFDRLYYKDSLSYITYNYIKNNITPEDKVVHDHFIAFPSAMKEYGCHFWHGCGTDYIDEYQPNYVIFNEYYRVNDKKYAETERLKQYIKEANLTFVKKIYGNNNENNITVSIYKKL